MSVFSFLPIIIMLILLGIVAALVFAVIHFIRTSVKKRKNKSERQAELDRMKIDDLE
jgi:MFS superfamily sulfate permease-like transporter